MASSDPFDEILNWRRYDERLTASGQPTEDQLKAIGWLGVSHVVNLGLHSHEQALPDEAGTVAAAGMSYIHMPVDFERPTDEDYRQFCAHMAELAGRTVHVHCILNARVSAFLYRYRVEMLGVPEAQARADMETVWRPGGVWAAFIGDIDAIDRPHAYAGRDY